MIATTGCMLATTLCLLSVPYSRRGLRRSTLRSPTPFARLANLHRIRQPHRHRFYLLDEFVMLLPQAFEFVGEVERRQNRQIHRIGGLAAGANGSDPFVDRPGHIPHPVVVRIAGYDQVLAHDFDVDTFHWLLRLLEFHPIKARQDLLDSGPYFSALIFMRLTL